VREVESDLQHRRGWYNHRVSVYPLSKRRRSGCKASASWLKLISGEASWSCLQSRQRALCGLTSILRKTWRRLFADEAFLLD